METTIPDLPEHHLRAALACGPMELGQLAQRMANSAPGASLLLLKLGVLRHIRPGGLRFGQGWQVELDTVAIKPEARSH